MSLFENSARVPLIIYDPRAAGNGKASSRTVELVDLHATLADLCRLKPPRTEGANLSLLLANPNSRWDRPAFTQVSRGTPTATGELISGDWFMGYSVRTDRYRYIEWDEGRKGVQLFDYAKDPGELKNLAEDPAYAETVKQMKALFPRK